MMVFRVWLVEGVNIYGLNNLNIFRPLTGLHYLVFIFADFKKRLHE